MTEPTPSLRKSRPQKSTWPRWLLLIVFLAVVTGGVYWYKNRFATKAVEYRTVKIGRGDVTQSVTANGQLTTVKMVQVGSQISGTITEINADFNFRVKAGELIAKIDPAMYERNLSQAEAELASAAAALALAQFNFKRSKELFGGRLISETEYTQAEVNLLQAEAVVKMRQAHVERAAVDLERTRILAPIDGIVISRNVEEGQTVAASLSTPTLFLIANDLSKMQIEAAVSEADVGGVDDGQPVNFTVEAYTRQFSGHVKQVRFAPVTNQNVVTYTAIVEVDNLDLKLRPGMTATASIITAQKSNTLRIPNAAFRFRPPEGVLVTPSSDAQSSTGGASTNKATNAVAANIATSGPFAGLPTPPWTGRRSTPAEREQYEASLTPEQREQFRQRMDEMRARFAQGGGGGGGFGGGPSGAGGLGSSPRSNQDGPRTQTIYLLETEKTPSGQEKSVLKPVTIRTGITDGSNTEVIEGLNEGDVVVTGTVSPETTTAAGPPGGRGGFGGSPFGGGGPRRF